MTDGKMFCFSAVLQLWSQIFSTTAQDNFGLGPVCRTTTNIKVPWKCLLSYTIQRKPLFHVDAVRFLTISGKIICLDPSTPWAIKSVKYLDAKNKPQSVSNNTARHSVTVVPKKMSTTNTTSAQSSTIPLCTPPVDNSQKIDIRGHATTQKTEIPRTNPGLEKDWRGSTEATETFQLGGLAWEEEKETEALLTETTSSTVMKLDIRRHATQKTENKTEFPISGTKSMEQDWRGSSEATETFQLDGPTWKKGGDSLLTETTSSTIMNEPFINNGYFCLKGEKFKYLES
ncbi:uncharacterized protein LOC131526445 [Onychostoma macrolepis]|uniref:uncharacterized protein LOC131526445 n=1 Tax=Onychostoma macrolepis TaxID=369639 RepID=UPI00272C0C76|nr:uncharacterized protein LOC131526445 [Onychostoma macrolepis]